MQLYDQTSPINWVFRGEETPEQMQADPKTAILFSEPCVLYDNGVGGVYSFKPLSTLAARYGIEYDTPEEGFERLQEAMNPPASGMQDDIAIINERLDEHDAALMELAEIITEG